MATKKIRTLTNHPVFGQPAVLPTNVLPTIGDVLRFVWKLKCDMEQNAVGKNFKSVDTSAVIKQVVVGVSEIWKMAVED